MMFDVHSGWGVAILFHYNHHANGLIFPLSLPPPPPSLPTPKSSGDRQHVTGAGAGEPWKPLA